MAAPESDSKCIFSLDPYHVSEEFGFFLPDPLDKLPAYYQPWMDVALRVPQLMETHELRSHVNKMPLLSSSFLRNHREFRLAHLALSIMTAGYTWQEGEDDPVEMLPCNLAIPFWEVSQRLGLPPILTHADVILTNWRKKDPEGPLTIENLELLFNFPGGDNSRCFIIVTMLVEMAAVPALKDIPTVINGVRVGDAEAVTRALEVISQSIQDMTDGLKLMHAHVEPSAFYGTLRIVLSGWKDNCCLPNGLVYEGVQTEPMQYSGGSAAQSSVMQCFDELLGVKHEGHGGAFLASMRSYMLPPHRRLIEDISQQPSLKSFVQQQANEELNKAFTHCVTKLLTFRNQHINLVSRFVIIPAARARQIRAQSKGQLISKPPVALERSGTGGSSFMTFLKTVRDETKQTLPPATNEETHQRTERDK
ncbi:indoleamine 2,3-dioxygenase 2-like [Brachionichthys hirsutus]|uniref:indoleamine 2,3-dioxygenase 2-like n=1 Tax=Brachionichthys hirsutus TaxID=412623 RepID=UPI003604B300